MVDLHLYGAVGIEGVQRKSSLDSAAEVMGRVKMVRFVTREHGSKGSMHRQRKGLPRPVTTDKYP